MNDIKYVMLSSMIATLREETDKLRKFIDEHEKREEQSNKGINDET